MDTVKSFKGYGKVDPLEEQAFKRKTRKRLIISVVSLIVLASLIVGAVAGTVTHSKNKKNRSSGDDVPSTAASIKSVCNITTYPDSCYSSLQDSNSTDPKQLFHLSLEMVLASLQKLSAGLPRVEDTEVQQALAVCQTVFDDAIDMLNESISALKEKESEKPLSTRRVNDLRTWLSSALTDQETCLDALEEVNATIIGDVKLLMKNSTEYASNSLAIVTRLLGPLANYDVSAHRQRKLLSESGFPEWVRAGDRRLLQANMPRPDVTVARDGSGDVTTVKEAVARVPKRSKKRFVIYVRAGVYQENVVLDKTLWNVMIYGDGKTESIISFHLNKVDGVKTFFTATVGVEGKNFIAKDIGFKNTAGPEKHQAVALRSGSDQSVFYRCSFDGFQDTLYTHKNRQYYRECDVTGTVDFIFGNAAVVLQKCLIRPRQPMPNQFITITAQGKKDPNQNTGISIQNCDLSPLDNLTVPTYLGRPWKDYSTTVIMHSKIGGFLEPLGWAEWETDVEPPSTIFYGESDNSGPGSSVAERVNWAGYKPRLSANQASKFTVKSFIDGDEWLPQTKVPFD